MSVLTRPSAEAAAPARRWRTDSSLTLPLCLLGSAVAVWAAALHAVDLDKLSDIGLISALPATYWLAVGLLTAGFFTVLSRDERPGWLLGTYLVAAVLFLHGVPGFIEGAARFPTSWVHAGFAEQIMSHHSTLPGLDARFSWPGFFSAAALVADAGGVSPLWFVRWAPVAVNLACLLPLVAILRTSGVDSRVRWIALWLFVVANWVGQDYFAPQALAFFLYLVFVAVVLRFFRPAHAEHVPYITRLRTVETLECPVEETTPGVRLALVAVLLAISAATIVAHQLTPFALLAVAAALVVGRRTTLNALPVLLLVAALAWISFGAEVYWRGHIADVTGGVGKLGAAVGAGLDKRLHGSAGHLMVVRLRLVAAAGMWLLAAWGALRAFRRNGRLPWTYLILAGAPLSLVAVQSYGGEILLRVYLFSLPFVALLAALVFVPGRRRLAAAAAVSMVMTALFVTIRYGNERFESFTKDEVAAVRYVMREARPGDRIVAVNPSLPWRDHDIGTYKFIGQIDEQWIDDGNAVLGYIKPTDPKQARPGMTGYLVLTKSQAAYGEVVEGRPAGWMDDLERRTLATGQAQVVFRNDDATVLRSRS